MKQKEYDIGMKELACLTLAILTLNQPLAMGAEPPPERRELQFVQRTSFFGALPIEVLVPLAEPAVTFRVRPQDGNGESFSAYGYDNPFLDSLVPGVPIMARHHPLPAFRTWLASSAGATAELALAEQAASQEDAYRLLTLGFLFGGALPLGFSFGPDGKATGVLAWAGIGLMCCALVPAVLGGAAKDRSVDHIGRAVWFWNNGQ